MKTSVRDNIARFFYDTAKLSMGVLVLGAITQHPFPLLEFVLGFALTLIFMSIGVRIELVPEQEA